LQQQSGNDHQASFFAEAAVCGTGLFLLARLNSVFFPAFCRRPEDTLGAAEQRPVGRMETHLVKSCRQDVLQEAAHIAFWQARKVNG